MRLEPSPGPPSVTKPTLGCPSLPVQIAVLAVYPSEPIPDACNYYSASSSCMRQLVSWKHTLQPRLLAGRRPGEREVLVLAYQPGHFDALLIPTPRPSALSPVVAAAPHPAPVVLDGLQQMLANKEADCARDELTRARIQEEVDVLMDNGVRINPVCEQLYGAKAAAPRIT